MRPPEKLKRKLLMSETDGRTGAALYGISFPPFFEWRGSGVGGKIKKIKIKVDVLFLNS